MPMLKVAIPFTVNLDPTDPPRDPALPTTYVFPVPGTYDVPDEVANHWYTAAHLEGYEAPPIDEIMADSSTEIMEPIPEEPPPAGAETATRRQPRPQPGERQSPPE